MNEVELEIYLLSKPASKKEFPFDEVTAVFKVMNKMFALVGYKKGLININLKCLPEDALGYRDIYIPLYTNKKIKPLD